MLIIAHFVFTTKFFNYIISLVMKMDNDLIIEKIYEEIDKIQPFLMSEGGMMEFVKFEDGILYIRMGGACSDCSLIDVTLKDGIEQIICSEIPEVKEVVKVD